METQSELLLSLENIGLSVKEARVYLALLSLESATAYRIAEHCEVKKPTVYVILEDLLKKGLVLKVPHVKKALYAPRSLEEYLMEQEGRLTAVHRLLPKLKALGMKRKPNVFFYSGLRGMSEAVDFRFEAMRGKTFCSFYGNLEGTDPMQIRAFEAWDKKATDAGISFQIIMPEKEKHLQNNLIGLAEKQNNIAIRFLQDYTYPSNIFIGIGDDFVQILDSKNLYATIIDDLPTARALKQIFQIVWEKGV